MKRETGKKIGKIVLLVVLLAMVGVIVYAVMVCPVNPTRMKPAKSYEQLRDTVEKKTDIRVPGEDLLPWTVTERQFRMDGPSRLAKVSGPQACAPDGGQPQRGHQEQCVRHL